MVPIYPDHLGAVSSSWLPDSASKLVIIIYWDWLTFLTKEIVLVNADDPGERWSWSQILHPRFYGEMIHLSSQLTGSHRTPCSPLKCSHSQGEEQQQVLHARPRGDLGQGKSKKGSSILMYKHWMCEISQANSQDPDSASFGQHREALYAYSVSLPPQFLASLLMLGVHWKV